MISGTAGSAKTEIAAQFPAEGIKRFDQNEVFVTFEESVEDSKKNMLEFNWPISQWEKEKKWCFDVSGIIS